VHPNCQNHLLCCTTGDCDPSKDLKIIAKTGEVVPVTCICTTDTDDNQFIWVKIKKTDKRSDTLETIGGNIPDGSLFQFILHIETGQMHLSYVSETWETVTGTSAATAKSDITETFSYIHAEDFPTFMQTLELSTKTLAVFDIEFRYRDKWLHVMTRPRREDEHVIFDGILLDITQRKEIENALKESEKTPRYVFDNIHDGFWIADIKTGKYSFVGGACFEIFGYTNEEIMQQNLYDLFEKPMTESKLFHLVEEKTEEYKKTGVIQYFKSVEQLYRKDGTKVWIEHSVQLTPDENGELTQIVGVDRNIDDIKEAEMRLENERKLLKTLVDNIPDSSLYQSVLDEATGKMHLTYVGGAWEEVTGVSADVALGDFSNIIDAIHPEDLPVFWKSVEYTAKALTNYNIEFRLKNNDWIH
jgi:PAS domain S-box-containing protein